MSYHTSGTYYAPQIQGMKSPWQKQILPRRTCCNLAVDELAHTADYIIRQHGHLKAGDFRIDVLPN